MTPDDKRTIQETWQQVLPIGDTAARLFYDRLFEIDPTTRPLFRAVDLPAQRGRLLQALTMAVRGLDHLDSLVPAVEDLGRRHVAYGVADAHYDSVGAALLWTLEQGLGAAWTPAARTAWSEAYGLISGAMRRAAREAQPAA